MSPPSPRASDIIATRGECLKKRPPTPIVLPFFNPYFYERLCHDLLLLRDKQNIREEIYSKKLAAESRLAHTPASVRDQFQSDEHQDIREWMATLTPATPSTSYNTPGLLSPSPSPTPPTRDASLTSPITPSVSYQEPAPTAKPSQKRKRTSDEADKEGGLAPLKRMKPLEPHRPLRRSPRLLEKKGRG